jgi:hypothetical protein
MTEILSKTEALKYLESQGFKLSSSELNTLMIKDKQEQITSEFLIKILAEFKKVGTTEPPKKVIEAKRPEPSDQEVIDDSLKADIELIKKHYGQELQNAKTMGAILGRTKYVLTKIEMSREEARCWAEHSNDLPLQDIISELNYPPSGLIEKSQAESQKKIEQAEAVQKLLSAVIARF